jgi:dihydropteroate synthase
VSQGARIINSVSLAPAAELGRVAAEAGADLVLTHCRGAMSDMAGFSSYAHDAYGDVVDDVVREWEHAADEACAAGLPRQRLIFDPGLGFAKNATQSLELCARLGELKQRLGVRVLVGPSRKSFIAKTVARRLGDTPEHVPPPSERLGGTIAAVIDCVARGADIVRVHDVAPVVQALAYVDALTQLQSSDHGGRGSDPVSAKGDRACSRD